MSVPYGTSDGYPVKPRTTTCATYVPAVARKPSSPSPFHWYTRVGCKVDIGSGDGNVRCRTTRADGRAALAKTSVSGTLNLMGPAIAIDEAVSHGLRQLTASIRAVEPDG